MPQAEGDSAILGSIPPLHLVIAVVGPPSVNP